MLHKFIQHLGHCVQFSAPFALTHKPPEFSKGLKKTESPQELSNIWNRSLILRKKDTGDTSL